MMLEIILLGRNQFGTLRLESVCKVYARVYATCFHKNKRKQREIKKVGRSVARCPNPR